MQSPGRRHDVKRVALAGFANVKVQDVEPRITVGVDALPALVQEVVDQHRVVANSVGHALPRIQRHRQPVAVVEVDSHRLVCQGFVDAVDVRLDVHRDRHLDAAKVVLLDERQSVYAIVGQEEYVRALDDHALACKAPDLGRQFFDDGVAQRALRPGDEVQAVAVENHERVVVERLHRHRVVGNAASDAELRRDLVVGVAVEDVRRHDLVADFSVGERRTEHGAADFVPVRNPQSTLEIRRPRRRRHVTESAAD